jgi:shikimate dehydrogenase
VSNLLEKCCLIGESVGGDPTHFMIERAIEDLGLDWRFLSFQTQPERLAEALAGADALGFAGVRLRGALSDKPAGVATRTARAKRTGRLTHLTRHDGALQGDDATGPALVEALAEIGEPAGKRVVVLGAGGDAPSIADVLVERGAALVAIADPSADRRPRTPSPARSARWRGRATGSNSPTTSTGSSRPRRGPRATTSASPSRSRRSSTRRTS